MASERSLLNKQQTGLRRLMTDPGRHDQAMALFLRQHALLHARRMAESEPWSLEDEILDDMAAEQIRRIPQGGEHSVAWCIWHIARIEDLTMNLLVAGSPQLVHREGWLERLRAPIQDTGNAMDVSAVAALSAALDLEALRDYRVAVGRRTREIVRQLAPEALQQRVDPLRVRRVMEEGAVVEPAQGIAEYWSRRTIAGLLLMPASRHLLVHLNEALALKRRRR